MFRDAVLGNMTIIRSIQWLIAWVVVAYGVALFGHLGVTAILFVGAGLGYCALAAWAGRLTIVPLLLAWIANAWLGFVSWRTSIISLESVIANTRYSKGREAGYLDFITLDGVAAFIILVLLAGYLSAVILQWKELSRRPWL